MQATVVIFVIPTTKFTWYYRLTIAPLLFPLPASTHVVYVISVIDWHHWFKDQKSGLLI